MLALIPMWCYSVPMSTKQEQFIAPGLPEAMALQGRTMAWLARQVGVDAPLLTHATRGRRTLSADVARMISTLIGVPFDVLFESPSGDKSAPSERNAA